jgi:GDPmannose 4,6-dehydratase
VSRKKALITGVTGQDGAFLAKLLLEKGYEVYGGLRRTSTSNLWRLEELGIADSIVHTPFELLESSNIRSVIRQIRPDEIYNLAAQSFVKISFDQPIYTAHADGIGVAYLLEAIRECAPSAKLYQASTSEMFGKVREIPQSERTPLHPRSPYAVAKAYAHFLVQNYREAYGLFACSGILFNHESQLRGLEFVTRKISATLAQIRNGSNSVLELGNLDAKRDWGYAPEYVEGMWRMLQNDTPEDFVLATGRTHTVRQFVESAASELDCRVEWEGEGLDEVGRAKETGQLLVRVNPIYHRPAEVDLLVGDPTKAKLALAWTTSTSMDALARKMARADFERLQQGVRLV